MLQLPPLPLALTGGSAAAGRRQAPRGRHPAAGTWHPAAALERLAAALPPKAYKQAVIHQMLNTTTIMLTSKWLIHRVYKRFRQKV